MTRAYYFSHDSNAARDPKVLQMRSVYRAEGYGWYWMLIEQMREQPNYKLPLGNKYAINAYALQMDANAERLQQFINDCVTEFHLFNKDDEFLWSESLIKRMEFMDIKSQKARQSALERWGKTNVKDANALRSQCDSNAKKRKEKKGKEKKVVASLEDYTDRVLTPLFPNLDFKVEREKFDTWWGEGDKELTRPKSAFRNWCERAEGYRIRDELTAPAAPKGECTNTMEDYGL